MPAASWYAPPRDKRSGREPGESRTNSSSDSRFGSYLLLSQGTVVSETSLAAYIELAVAIDIGKSQRGVIVRQVPAIGIVEVAMRQEEGAEAGSCRQLTPDSVPSPPTNIGLAVAIDVGEHHRGSI